jgi:hypothetical protein
VALKDFSRSKSHEAAKFQAQMMEFALGAVTAAELRQDGDEVVLTVSMVDMSLNPRGTKTKRNVEISVQTEAPESANGDLPSLADLGYGRRRRAKPKRDAAANGWSKLAAALIFELGEQGEGRSETVLGLIDEGADVNATNPASKERPLNVAAEHGRVECLKFLLDAGAAIDAKSGAHGETALHSAVRGQHSAVRECVTVLLDAGADASKKNLDMLSPVALADKTGQSTLRKFMAAKVGAPSLAALAKSTR